MNAQHIPEVIVVDLAMRLSFDGRVGHIEDAGVLEYGVVGLLGKVKHSIGVKFPCQIEAVHIALSAAGGDVAPSVFGVQTGELGEVENDLAFELMGVGPVVGFVERVSHVVESMAEEWD